MEHPDPRIQQNQADFLSEIPEDKKAYHERLFRIGNATYVYHQLAYAQNNDKQLESYYHEWLKGLPANLANEMQTKGFQYCKTIWAFTRYVNERNDIGMSEWMKEHLSVGDYEYYNEEGQSQASRE